MNLGSKLSISCQRNQLISEDNQRAVNFVIDGISSVLLPKDTPKTKQTNRSNHFINSTYASCLFIIYRLKDELMSSRSIYSHGRSVLSGIEDCDLPQTLQRIIDYVEKHPYNLKQATLI